jgi:hypothetical protein
MSPSSRDEAVPVPATWEGVGTPAPDALVDDRLQLHHAFQLVATFGQSLVPERPDDSHRGATWDPARRLLLSEPAAGGVRLALAPSSLAVCLLEGVEERARLGLRGRTVEEAREWLEVEGREVTGGPLEVGRPEFQIPTHDVGEGMRFSAGTAGLAELERWFQNAQLALEAVRGVEPRASEVRCWPHHFDIATLVVVQDADAPEGMRTVGLGLSPGDDSYAEPYWYGSPWPPPPVADLPALEGLGRWHVQGWVGAVLTGSELVAAGDGPDQGHAAAAFLDSALRAGLALLRG